MVTKNCLNCNNAEHKWIGNEICMVYCNKWEEVLEIDQTRAEMACYQELRRFGF